MDRGRYAPQNVTVVRDGLVNSAEVVPLEVGHVDPLGRKITEEEANT